MTSESGGAEAIAAAGGFDPTMPNAARVYDYLLGGKDNFAADRQAAKALLAALPDVAQAARTNRAFAAAAVQPGLVPLAEWPLDVPDGPHAPPAPARTPSGSRPPSAPTRTPAAAVLAGIGRKLS